MTNQQASMRTEKLSEAKRALLARRLGGRAVRKGGADGIPVRESGGVIPLSPAQERIWFLTQLDAQSHAYNMYSVIRFEGPLELATLADCFDTLVRRHSALRTHIAFEDGLPCQVVDSNVTFDVPVSDLTDLPLEAREASSRALIEEEVRRPFTLEQSPLMRFLLIKLSADDHIAIVTAHHIVIDEWSIEVFWRELSKLYAARLDGVAAPLPDLPIEYADYAIWQRQKVTDSMDAQLSYWREQLGVESHLLNLPADHPRPSNQTFAGANTWLTLSDEITAGVQALNHTYGTTTFMTMLAVFQILLHRYSGQNDVLVGTPIADRGRPETRELIGFFLNTLVMRADFAGDPQFATFLKQTRQTALDGYSHQDLPFDRLVDHLLDRRDPGYNPIFQVMFVHQKVAAEEINIPAVKVTPIDVATGVSKFDLTLFVREKAQGLSVGLEYNVALFEAESAQRMLEHFHVLLQSILNDPEQRVSELEFITQGEWEKITGEWNDTDTDLDSATTIHEMIETQVERTGERLAVVDNSRSLTYEELDRRSNQLANHLQGLGIRNNSPVGLYMERSVEMMVSILAVLKAGGAYLPLDPAYPSHRLEYMLADAQATVVITQEQLVPSLPGHHGTTVCIDSEWGQIGQAKVSPPVCARAADDLAYIIYTSGSTGTPRGVPVSHRNLVHSTSARSAFYDRPPHKFLLLPSFTFDSSIVGIFWTLCQGGTLVLPPQHIEREPRRVADIIAEHGISHLLTLPALYDMILEFGGPDRLSTLTTAIVAGEECRRELVAHHYSRIPHATLYNEYGPTEATVWSTAYKIPPDFGGTRVPIGRPIANTRNYILDANARLLPVGIPGELWIGGAGVTGGYLNQPDITAEKFVEHPLAGNPPARLYRTGDLARWLPDGDIEFMGRVDQQVKIRGYRIEPGEIVEMLKGHSALRDAAVTVHVAGATTGNPASRPTTANDGGGSGEQRLVAYIVYKNGQTASPDLLRTFLSERLPEYMIPAAFVALTALPLTPNGKLDLRSLPEPDYGAESDVPSSPQTALESQLLAIWQHVLGIHNLGVEDNFFHVGGHSLLAVQLTARVTEETGQELPVTALFQGPTVRQQAMLLERSGWRSRWTSLAPIQPGGSQIPLFLVPPNGATSIRFAPLVDVLGADQPLYSFDSVGLDGTPPLKTIEEIAAHNVQEMLTVRPNGPFLLGGMCFGAYVAIEMALQLQRMGHEVPLLCIFDTSPPAPYALPKTTRARRRGVRYYAKRMGQLVQSGDLMFALRVFAARKVSIFRTWRMNRQHSRTAEFTAVAAANRKAQAEYRATPVDARIVCLQSEQSKRLIPAQRWSEMTSQSVEYITLPGTTHRRLLLVDGHVDSVAVKVKEILDTWMAADSPDRQP